MDEIRKQATNSFLDKYPQYSRVIDYYEDYIQGYILGCSETIVNSVYALVVNKSMTINTALDCLGIPLLDWDSYKGILDNAAENARENEE